MTITRNNTTYRLTPQELFQAYEEQSFLFVLQRVEALIKGNSDFQSLQFPEKQKAVREVAKRANGLTTTHGYHIDTAIILSTDNYFREVRESA